MIGFLIIAAVVISATGAFENVYISNKPGGSEVSNIEDIPYQVSVQLNGKHHCGGIIVTENYVLTTADCVRAGFYTQYTIRAGTTTLSKNDENVTIHKVNLIIKPNSYNADNSFNIPVNDIALIQVKTPFIFDGTRDAVPLLCKNSTRPGSIGKISGWGWLNSSNPVEQMRMGQIRISETQICNKQKCYKGVIPERQICVYSKEHTCFAGAGGALVIGNHLVGITSWMMNCDQGGLLCVYTDVLAYRKWINDNTRGNNLY